MVGEVTYSYTPEDWSQERFLELGGFTVVFLNYNKAAFIEKSVASALNQDFERLEMFFMDDASSDGSGDTMEKLVYAYRGRHKVTVVRNTENQHITGQWNIVSKLATGNWYGMFCGDDEALLNRATLAKRIVEEHPTIKGFCTAFEEARVNDEIRSTEGSCPNILVVHDGNTNLADIAEHRTPIIGATAWWHRSLFDKQLPEAPLDDVLLRWILQMRNDGCGNPIWVYEGRVPTVRYSVGTGITSESSVKNSELKSRREAWLANARARRKFASLMARTWNGISDYAIKNKTSHVFRPIINKTITKNKIIAGRTLARLRVVISAFRYGLGKLWLKMVAQEIMGDGVAACLSEKLHGKSL